MTLMIKIQMTSKINFAIILQLKVMKSHEIYLFSASTKAYKFSEKFLQTT